MNDYLSIANEQYVGSVGRLLRIRLVAYHRILYHLMPCCAPGLAAAVLAALVDVLSKPIVDVPMASSVLSLPLVISAMMYGVIGLGFVPLTRKRAQHVKIDRKCKSLLIVSGILEASARVTFLLGLQDSTAVRASILQHSETLFALLIAATLLRDSLRKKEAVPFGMIVIGVVVLPVACDMFRQGSIFTEWVLGDLLILLSGLLYAANCNLCKFIDPGVSAYRITQFESLVSAIALLAVIGVLRLPLSIDPILIMPIVLLGMMTAVSTVLYIVSIRMIGALRTVLLYATTSVFGVIFSGMILQEIVSIADGMSVMLILLGIYLLRDKLGNEEDDHAGQVPALLIATS